MSLALIAGQKMKRAVQICLLDTCKDIFLKRYPELHRFHAKEFSTMEEVYAAACSADLPRFDSFFVDSIDAVLLTHNVDWVIGHLKNISRKFARHFCMAVKRS